MTHVYWNNTLSSRCINFWHKVHACMHYTPSETNKMVMIYDLCKLFICNTLQVYFELPTCPLVSIKCIVMNKTIFKNFEVCMIHDIFNFIFLFFLLGYSKCGHFMGEKYIAFSPISFSMSVSHFHMQMWRLIHVLWSSFASCSFTCPLMFWLNRRPKC